MSNARIDKFHIASDGDGAVVADMHRASGYAAAGNSETHGYCAGGDYPLTASIDRFDFAAESNGVDHGDLVNFSAGKAGSSGTTHAYVSGGNYPTGSGTTGRTSIDEFAYASNVTATNAGDLDNGVYGPGGTHV